MSRILVACEFSGVVCDADGMTEIRYEGATVLTKEQWALVELFIGDL